MTSPQNLSEDKLNLAIYNAIRYLNNITSMETELGVVYSEAESVILSAKRIMNKDPQPILESRLRDSADSQP